MKGKIIVISPILAPLKDDNFSYRIFAKVDYNDFTVINNWERLPEEQRTQLEDSLYDKGYIKLHYLFPRKDTSVSDIDWFSYFVRPLYYVFKNKAGIKFKLIDIQPEDVKIGVYASYIGRIKAGIFHEMIKPRSTFIFEGEILAGKAEKDLEFEAQIGKWRNLGFGRVKIKVIED